MALQEPAGLPDRRINSSGGVPAVVSAPADLRLHSNTIDQLESDTGGKGAAAATTRGGAARSKVTMMCSLWDSEVQAGEQNSPVPLKNLRTNQLSSEEKWAELLQGLYLCVIIYTKCGPSHPPIGT